MYQKYQTIQLNGEYFDKEELKTFTTNSSQLPVWEKDIFDFIFEWLDENPTIQAKTSGTTGTPKTIFLEKNKMVNSALHTGRFF